MKTALHMTSGDIAGELLRKSSLPGEVFVWHDILYGGERKPGWPDSASFEARADFIGASTGGGLSRSRILGTMKDQYAKLKRAGEYETLVLWFDACLFDQAMLCHILSCLKSLGNEKAELLCIDAYPGIEPYHGLGQLSPGQLAAEYGRRQPLDKAHFHFAERVDRAFALQDKAAFKALAALNHAPLPWVPAAVKRWLEEFPDRETGLGRLERLAFEAIRSGCETPGEVFASVASKETPPQYWGDITLWEKINALADRELPLIRIEGPQRRLPQWEGPVDLKQFRLYSMA